MPIDKTLLDRILIKVDMAFDNKEKRKREEFRNSLLVLKQAGCSYYRIGRIFGYERRTVRNWDVLNIMPMDPVVVKKIISSAQEILSLQKI